MLETTEAACASSTLGSNHAMSTSLHRVLKNGQHSLSKTLLLFYVHTTSIERRRKLVNTLASQPAASCAISNRESAAANIHKRQERHTITGTLAKRRTPPVDLPETLLSLLGPPAPPDARQGPQQTNLIALGGGLGVQGSPGEPPGGRQVVCVFFEVSDLMTIVRLCALLRFLLAVASTHAICSCLHACYCAVAIGRYIRASGVQESEWGRLGVLWG